jgi:hypothetical protein
MKNGYQINNIIHVLLLVQIKFLKEILKYYQNINHHVQVLIKNQMDKLFMKEFIQE